MLQLDFIQIRPGPYMEPDVFSYSDPLHFLKDSVARKQAAHPLLSVRSLAQKMGMKSHTALVHFLQGKRQIRPQHAEGIAEGLRLNPEQKNYFEALVHWDCAESETEKQVYKSKLDQLHPAKDSAVLELERFKLVADWAHMAILEMTTLDGFRSDANWISQRLGSKISAEKVSEAITRLLNLKLLQWQDGSLVKTNERLTTPKDRASESIREHHKQVINQALLAIDTQTVEERFVTSCAMSIDKNRLPEAKELIRKFRSDLSKLLEKNPGDETYQLSVQLFRLTEPEREN